MQKFFVVSDRECPGSEHDTYEEAQTVVNDLQKKGLHEARILMPPDYLYHGAEEVYESQYLSYSYP